MVKRVTNPNPMPLNKVRILFELGYMSEEDAIVYFEPTGITGNGVAAFLELAWKPMPPDVASEWKAQAEIVVGRFKEEEIDRTTAWKLLQDIGYSSVEADVVLDYLTGE